jgi:hypothetical protein
MSDEQSSWDERFRQFLRKTGEDFRRAGDEMRAEAQKLMEAAMDPQKQQQIRDRMNELGSWARDTAQGMAGAMQEAATKANTAWQNASERVAEATQQAATQANTAFQSARDKVAEATDKVRGKVKRKAKPVAKKAAAKKAAPKRAASKKAGAAKKKGGGSSKAKKKGAAKKRKR